MTTRRAAPAALLIALLLPLLPSYAAADADEEGATHDSFSATLRVHGHGRCTLTKSDAAVRASLRCRDGLRTRVRPCPQRDSRRCFWHAPSRGDGQGRSFLALAGRRHPFRA